MTKGYKATKLTNHIRVRGEKCEGLIPDAVSVLLASS